MRSRPLAALCAAVLLGFCLRNVLRPEPIAVNVAPVEVSVLTYNIHGLPAWIARDAPGERIARIGRLAGSYDVALFQEDFAHHAALVESADHLVVVRGNAQRSTWMGDHSFFCGDCGSGLTTMTRFARRFLLEVRREPFEKCSGWVSPQKRLDCLATKGYLMTRFALTNGTQVDFYNVHLDAGVSQEDQRVREHQLGLLRERILDCAHGHALVVGGDFNLRPTVPQEAHLLARFRSRLALTQAAVGLDSEPWTKQRDYLFFRSGGGTALELLDAGAAEEFVHAGKHLSDHPALFARFRVHAVNAAMSASSAGIIASVNDSPRDPRPHSGPLWDRLGARPIGLGSGELGFDSQIAPPQSTGGGRGWLRRSAQRG